MYDYADLEISLSRDALDTNPGRQDARSYRVDLRLTQPDSDEENPPERGVTRFDFAALDRLRPDASAYGKRLSQDLFSDPRLLPWFDKACVLTLSQNQKLRVKLCIDRSAPELHDLRWETLYDPREDHQNSWLLNNENVLFSRYLWSDDWRSVKVKPKRDLRALVVVANPSDISTNAPNNRPLAPVDVAGELERARRGLGQMMSAELASDPAAPGQVTLNNLIKKLHDGFDILYLVCHGALVEDRFGNIVPHLYLEKDDGKAIAQSGLDIVDLLGKLATRPQLVVLASCQSAGNDRGARASDVDGALAALGPKLAAAGVPAVLAMHGNVTMKTVAGFIPEFFQRLCEHGQIDQAMAAARSQVAQRPDAWMPVLFTRLRGGRFWYKSGFRSQNDGPEFEKWDALLLRIHERKCTPILGFGLLEPLVGSAREIAQNWANTYGFPLERHNSEALPQVAQYLATKIDSPFPYEQIQEYLVKRIQNLYGQTLPAELRQTSVSNLDQLLKKVVEVRALENPYEPYRVLSKLPFPLYITTNLDNLLANSLEAEGKTPHVELCPWNTSLIQKSLPYEGTPTDQSPLIYQLFGQFREPDSLVLTEDDYFDYLIGVTNNTTRIPEVVLRAQADSPLLFLGFYIDDWNFRVLLRSIQRPGASRRRRYHHVAVQIDPEGDRLLNPNRARQFLEKYFGDDAYKIDIYWGSTEEFIRELASRWNERYGREVRI
jgi:hypothetical protein